MSEESSDPNHELLARLASLEVLVKQLVANNSPHPPPETPPPSEPEDDPDGPPKGPTPPLNPDGGPGVGLSPEVRSRFEMIEIRLKSLEDGAIPPEVVEDLIEIIRMVSGSISDPAEDQKSTATVLASALTPFNSTIEIYQSVLPAMLAAQAQILKQNLELSSAGAASGAELFDRYMSAAQELHSELMSLSSVAGRDVSEEATAAVRKATAEVQKARRMQERAQ